MDDRVGNRPLLDQLFLRELGAEIAAGLQALGADDRQRDMMADPRGRLGRDQVAPGRLKEVHRDLVLEGRRVGEIDDDFGAGQCVGEALAGDRVDPGVGRRGNRLMPRIVQLGDDFRTGQPGSSNHDDLHRLALPLPARSAPPAIVLEELAATLQTRDLSNRLYQPGRRIAAWYNAPAGFRTYRLALRAALDRRVTGDARQARSPPEEERPGERSLPVIDALIVGARGSGGNRPPKRET